jgi:hypothetical protein
LNSKEKLEFSHYRYKERILVDSDSIAIAMIEELLRYEGDIRLCLFQAKNAQIEDVYLPLEEDFHRVDSMYSRYSIQVQALYLISQIYYENVFKHMMYPILCDYTSDSNCLKCNSIDGDLVRQAYRSVRKWLIEVKKERRKPFYPHVGSPI